MTRKHSASSTDSCQHMTVAESGIGHVSICPDCSVLHLSLSHVSLRFTPDAFRALAAMVGQAQERLAQVARSSAAAAAVIDEARHGPKLH